MKNSATILLGTAAVATLVLSGCAGGETDAAEGGVTSVTIAINPSAQSAPLYYGIQEGVFEEHGLDVEVVPQTDVAAIMSGVASGQYDFGFGTVVHIINANLNGIEARAVATVEGQQKDDEAPDEGNALVAAPGSGITHAGELDGHTLGVVGLASLNSFAAMDMIARGGGDPESVELVQLPFGQMTAGLTSGELDAAVLQAPFIADAVAAGGTIIGKPNVETFPNMAVGVYLTSQSYIDGNEELVQAFSDAMIESQELAAANVDEARLTLVDELGITEEAAKASVWNTGSDPHVDVDGFAKAQVLLMTYGDQTEELDVNELVWPGALGE